MMIGFFPMMQIDNLRPPSMKLALKLECTLVNIKILYETNLTEKRRKNNTEFRQLQYRLYSCTEHVQGDTILTDTLTIYTTNRFVLTFIFCPTADVLLVFIFCCGKKNPKFQSVAWVGAVSNMRDFFSSGL